ncbi:unnamed protein product [Oikopleura dioica]|uniref:Uncharacterized protein n=1 Tax=Oikopleura dioica TaxID=34765 RepID=E4XHU0_OIKDI|nr:unnamed protein product [Oikopleura dioica]
MVKKKTVKIVIIVNRSRQKKLRKRAKTGRNQLQKIGLIWSQSNHREEATEIS